MKSPPPAPAHPSSSHQPTTTAPHIYTYHCLCTTLLLTTPYDLSFLPVRASPSSDNTRILPLPTISSEKENPGHEAGKVGEAGIQGDSKEEEFLPSLLSNTRPARKAIVLQREDGWEKRRVWRCGRCALGWGYEIEGAGVGAPKEKRARVMYLLEGGLVETEAMMRGEEGS